MERAKIKILSIEPSDLLYEGLKNSLLKSGLGYLFIRTTSLKEGEEALKEQRFHCVIVNPAAIYNRVPQLQKLKRLYKDLHWIALLHSLIEPELLLHFNTTLSLYDSRQEIVEKIEGLSLRKATPPTPKEELTEREKDILKHLIKGDSNRTISQKLNISVHTVVSHRKNIARKTGIKSLPALAIYAITSKLLPLE
ncbi:MAG: LuxR C-terminal-related transcriptional regulator [Bacteroidales bacterium]